MGRPGEEDYDDEFDGAGDAGEEKLQSSGGESEASGTRQPDAPTVDSETGPRRAEESELEPIVTWNTIWRNFSEKRKKSGSSAAWASLQLDFASNADKIVPVILNGKDFTAMMSDIEERIKNERGTGHADPNETVANWLRGEELGKVQ